MAVGYGVMYVVGVAYIIGVQGYILSNILDWGVWCETPLDVVCINHSPAPIYGGYLLRTGVYCGACCAPGTISACCTWHMCSLYVVLGAHLCVGYMWCLERTYVLAICVLGCLACTWCKRGVALEKFQTFPISY